MGEEAIDTKATPRSDSSAGSIPRKGSVTVERQLPDQEWQEYRSTKRGLTRHVQLMAIGGSIGTGLFVGIGGPLSNAGPLNVREYTRPHTRPSTFPGPHASQSWGT